LVLVKNVPWFKGAKKGKAAGSKETDLAVEALEKDILLDESEDHDNPTSPAEELLQYLKNPNPSTVLVLLAPGEVDRRRKLYRTLASLGIAVECREMNDRERRSWLIGKARAIGLDFEPAALDYLINFGGKSLWGLANELEKLSLFLDIGGSRVTLETMQVLCPRNLEERIFDIMQAVTEKNPALALSRIRELTRAGIQPQRIFYLLVRHYRIMLRAKGLTGQAYTDQELANHLQVDYRIAAKYLRESRGLSEINLVKGLKWMLEIDVEFKTGRNHPETALEVLIAQTSVPDSFN
jgi:DNA polymerase-3 subunit delta